MESIVNKELTQLRKDYGDLLITTSEAQQELHSLRNQCDELRTRLISSEYENSKLKEKLTEVNILKKQNVELYGEVTRLESLKGVIEGENRELKKEKVKIEEYYKKEKNIVVEKLKEQKEKSENNYKKLENRYNAVMVSATNRYKELNDRVLSLEKEVAILKNDSLSSGSQLVDATIVFGEQESNRNESKSDGLAGVQLGYEITSNVERTTSSMPGSKSVSATCVKTQPESSEFDTGPVEEKLATSAPCIPKPPLVSPSIVNLVCSDDDAELPSPSALKRKLQTTDASDKREEDGSSSRKYTKSTDISGVILQPCVQKVGVESDSKFCDEHIPVRFGNSSKEWDYAVDMLDSLKQDAELCMKGVCALSRHHLLSLGEKALVKFLTDGDTKGRLKRTLGELDAFDPDGADECKNIAMIHYEELYGIYKEGNDPFFAHDTIFS